MTRRSKRTIPKKKLKKLAAALGGRAEIAEAIGMSRPAVDRYFTGKGMRQETYDAMMLLLAEHVDQPRQELIDQVEIVPEPPPLAQEGGHLYTLLCKALERNSGVDALQAQLTRMEARLMRIEENQRAHLHAWQMTPARMPADV